MNRTLVTVVALLGLSFSPLIADMYLLGVGDDHARSFSHDRYYVGADKAFIGEAFDWSGIGFSTSWGRFATMISPSYFLSASHSHPAIGESVRFYDGNSTSSPTYVYTVQSGVQIGGSDLWLGKLSTPISSELSTYPIYMPGASTNDLHGKEIYVYGTPSRVGRNIITGTGSIISFRFDTIGGLGEDEAYCMGGDSGGPSFGFYGNQLAVAGIHYYNSGSTPYNGAVTGDTCVPYYLDQLIAAMDGELFRVGPPNHWKGSLGDWTAAGNWVAGVPLSQSETVIGNGGTALFSAGDVLLNAMALGQGGQGTLRLTSGIMVITTAVFIGQGGTGVLNQEGGTLLADSMTLGASSGDSGAYSLSGTSRADFRSLTIGDSGSGTITQTGGRVAVVGSIILGKSASAASGTYIIGPGMLSAQALHLGDTGAGTLTISSSSADITLSQKLRLSRQSIVNAVSGSVIKMAGASLENINMTSASTAGMANIRFIFTGTGSVQTIEAAGRNIGMDVGGFSNNHGMGALQVGSAGMPATVRLVNTWDNQLGQLTPDVHHARTLDVAAGSTLDLNGLSLFYSSGTNAGTINLNGGRLIHDQAKTLYVWLEADRANAGEDFFVRVYAQILGATVGDGLANTAITVYTPDAGGGCIPRVVQDTGKVQTQWGAAVPSDFTLLTGGASDFDGDGDLDAVQMSLWQANSSYPDFANSAVLIATQTWQKLTDSPVTLALSISPSSSHWDPLITQMDFDLLKGTSTVVSNWLRGDVTRDGLINANDIDLLYSNFDSGSKFDLTGDGLADQKDVDELVQFILRTRYGDSNLNGLVSFDDFQMLLNNWQMSGRGWAQGDFTGDGVVSFTDFQAVLNNWQLPPISSSTPEPSTLVLLAAGMLAARYTRRQAQN